ncbi:N-acetyltransferase esco2 [Entophlyctis luteolus]|nr:N-acetyltransferase esco2 [Entophlyctis luteolus]
MTTQQRPLQQPQQLDVATAVVDASNSPGQNSLHSCDAPRKRPATLAPNNHAPKRCRPRIESLSAATSASIPATSAAKITAFFSPAATHISSMSEQQPSPSCPILVRASPTARPMVQSVLLVGQKSPGFSVCKDCGMRYSTVTKEDDAIHVKYHASIINGISYKGYASDVDCAAALFTSQIDDDTERKRRNSQRFPIAAKVIAVALNRKSVSSAQQKKIAEIMNVVDAELGGSISAKSSADNDYEQNEVWSGNWCVFLCTLKDRVIGCLLAEPIAFAVPLHDLTPPTNKVPDSPKSALYKVQERVSAICGISKIWVSKSHRRKGVGLKLLEACRRKFLFGCILEKDSMAFSQPTEGGRRLATTYFGKPDFLVYSGRREEQQMGE